MRPPDAQRARVRTEPTPSPEGLVTIYDVLRHLIEDASWRGTGGDIEERTRKAAALELVNRLEAMSLWGQIAIDVQEVIQ